MEQHAIEKCISENKRLHKNFNVSESGLVLIVENLFIGASPDSNVDCSCCGGGLLEVKCPSSIKREKASHKNIGFLILGENDKVILKQNHPFFLPSTRTKWCHWEKSLFFLFIDTLGFIGKELHSIQKFGKIFFKHCNSFGTNI